MAQRSGPFACKKCGKSRRDEKLYRVGEKRDKQYFCFSCLPKEKQIFYKELEEKMKDVRA